MRSPTAFSRRTVEHRIVLGLHALLLLLIGLHLAVLALPPSLSPIPEASEAEALWWGFWPVRYPPRWTIWLGVGLLLVVLLWQARRLVSPASRDERSHSPGDPSRWLVWISVALVAGFFAFPVVHTRWGDAYILTHGIAWPDPALRLTHSWQAPLDLFVHSQVWLAFHERMQWQDATPVYRLLSPLAGILYLAVALRLSRFPGLGPGWLVYGMLVSLGVVQLFFGYVENYSFAAAGILLYLWLGLSVLHGRRPLWLAGTALALLNATHPSTIVLTPSLLFVGWRVWRGGRLSAGQALLSIAAPVLLVAGGTLLLMEMGGHGLAALLGEDRPGGGDGRWLVPLTATTTRWEHYTLFSWPHLRDFINEQILVAPVVLPGLLILWAGRLLGTFPGKGRYSAGESDGRGGSFLLIAAACYWLFVWLWNPDYGGQRDWDLFSLSAIPAALLFVWHLPRSLTEPGLLRAGALPLVLFQALHTAAFVYQNRLPWAWPP